jgi:hypothetical protein
LRRSPSSNFLLEPIDGFIELEADITGDCVGLVAVEYRWT